jgi:hypothetical protein
MKAIIFMSEPHSRHLSPNDFGFTPGRPHAVPNKGKGSNRTGLPRSRWLRRIGVQDQIAARLKNSKSKPPWMTAERFKSLPDEITVRELRYQIHQKGFRTKTITLARTLLDDHVYSLPEIAELSRRCGEIETNFGHVKTMMKICRRHFHVSGCRGEIPLEKQLRSGHFKSAAVESHDSRERGPSSAVVSHGCGVTFLVIAPP